ncbi:MAG: hypothetical protein ABIB47_00580 [Candidatus Woesearchaeota archaeon]
MSDMWRIFGVTIIVLLAIISAVLIAAYVSRECNTNLDCGGGRYCAYNHKCYDSSSNSKSANLLPSALVIGIAIVISAYILKRGKVKK